ncbi:unannotated protein [freshwater metagenome]|uniref:Unannotated protein n=1 Tax=freshwater metagenome TaxID=449393 RepID=A0A6J6QXP5_9ZZZZ
MQRVDPRVADGGVDGVLDGRAQGGVEGGVVDGGGLTGVRCDQDGAGLDGR